MSHRVIVHCTVLQLGFTIYNILYAHVLCAFTSEVWCAVDETPVAFRLSTISLVIMARGTPCLLACVAIATSVQIALYMLLAQHTPHVSLASLQWWSLRCRKLGGVLLHPGHSHNTHIPACSQFQLERTLHSKLMTAPLSFHKYM